MSVASGRSRWGASRAATRPVEVQRKNYRRLYVGTGCGLIVIGAFPFILTAFGLFVWGIPTPPRDYPYLVAWAILMIAWLCSTLFLAWWWGPFDGFRHGGSRTKGFRHE